MSNINHELMESLEYKGEYGCRFNCRQCVHFGISNTNDYNYCDKQGIEVHWGNNVCRAFEPKIKNPSSPEFNFDDYLEFLYSQFYRPYSIDKDIITGSARLGEMIMDDGKLAKRSEDYMKMLEDNEEWDKLNNYKPYSYVYKYYDKPYCKAYLKDAYVKVNHHTFHIDYIRFRELNTVEDGAVKFKLHTWKDKPTQRKYKKEINNEFKVGGGE